MKTHAINSLTEVM